VSNPRSRVISLVHRFWSDLSVKELGAGIGQLLAATPPVTLIFGEEEMLGPKKTAVNKIELTDQLKQLHMRVYDRLNDRC
jgi:hypothetical protein